MECIREEDLDEILGNPAASEDIMASKWKIFESTGGGLSTSRVEEAVVVTCGDKAGLLTEASEEGLSEEMLPRQVGLLAAAPGDGQLGAMPGLEVNLSVDASWEGPSACLIQAISLSD